MIRTAPDPADVSLVLAAIARDYPNTTAGDDVYQLNGRLYAELPCRDYQPDEVLIVRATIHDRDNAESVSVLTVELEEVGTRWPELDNMEWRDNVAGWLAERDHDTNDVIVQ